MSHSLSIKGDEDFNVGITYNLSEMYYLASKNAGHKIDSLGEYLNEKKLKDIKSFLKDTLDELVAHPIKYKKLNPENGWGSYDSLVKSFMRLLIKANESPNSILEDWY